VEALPSTHEAVCTAFRALCFLNGLDDAAKQGHELSPETLHSRFIATGLLSDKVGAVLVMLRDSATEGIDMTDQIARELYREASLIHEQAQIALNKVALM
jgi:hypothetical protein